MLPNVKPTCFNVVLFIFRRDVTPLRAWHQSLLLTNSTFSRDSHGEKSKCCWFHAKPLCFMPCGYFVHGLQCKYWSIWGEMGYIIPDSQVIDTIWWAMMWDTEREHFLSTYPSLSKWFSNFSILLLSDLKPSNLDFHHLPTAHEHRSLSSLSSKQNV